MTSFVLVIFFIFFFLLSFRRPLWAGIFILATLPSYLIRFHIGPIPMTVLEGMILLFVLVEVAQVRPLQFSRPSIKNLNKKNLPFIILILLFVLSGFISIFMAPELNTALGLFKAYIIEPILFVLVFLLVLRPWTEQVPSLRIFIYSFGISTLIISLYAIFQKFTGFGIPNTFWSLEESRRVTSFFEYPNALGLYLGPIMIFYFGIFLRFWREKKIAILSFLVVVLGIVATIFAQSEGALFGILGGIFILVLFSFKNKKYSLSFLGLSLLLGIIFLIIPVTREYFFQKISLNDFSGGVRKEMWIETIDFLKTEPIFGAGLSGYQEKILPFHKNPKVEIFLYPHNFFLNFYVEMGLLGLISTIGLLILFFYRARKSPLLVAIMVEILVHGMVDAPFFKNDLAIIFLSVLCFGVLTDSSKTRILTKERAEKVALF